MTILLNTKQILGMICEIIFFRPNYRLVRVSRVLFNLIHSKACFLVFLKKIKDVFSKRKRKEVEKKASIAGFFRKTCLVLALNIFDKINSLSPIKNSQVSLKNFSSFEGIHYSISFLNSRTKHFHYSLHYMFCPPKLFFVICIFST